MPEKLRFSKGELVLTGKAADLKSAGSNPLGVRIPRSPCPTGGGTADGQWHMANGKWLKKQGGENGVPFRAFSDMEAGK